jgi:hypothetical protein
MKKTLLSLMAMMGVAVAQADDTTFPYLILETSDGTKTAVEVTSTDVALTFSGTTLTVGDKTFPLADLSKMYFAAENEAAGIAELKVADEGSIIAIYDLQVRNVSRDQMTPGIYVVKTTTGSRKVTVK